MIDLGGETQEAALSGALSGGVIGAGTGFIDSLSKKALLRRALLGALGGGALSGAAIGVGHDLLDRPEDDSAYTRSGAAGGLAVGSGLGALGGAALASGLLPAKAGMLKKMAGMGYGKASGLGAGLGGAVGAFQGSDEGMQLDFIKNELDRHQMKRLKERMGDV